jgi:hypothetical protein
MACVRSSARQPALGSTSLLSILDRNLSELDCWDSHVDEGLCKADAKEKPMKQTSDVLAKPEA